MHVTISFDIITHYTSHRLTSERSTGPNLFLFVHMQAHFSLYAYRYSLISFINADSESILSFACGSCEAVSCSCVCVSVTHSSHRMAWIQMHEYARTKIKICKNKTQNRDSISEECFQFKWHAPNWTMTPSDNHIERNSSLVRNHKFRNGEHK